MNPKMYRQGDVLIVESSKPVGLRQKMQRDTQARLILAEGESTGHAHAISSAAVSGYLYEMGTFLYVRESVDVQHEEHAPIRLDPGTYRVVRQRTFSGLGPVAD